MKRYYKQPHKERRYMTLQNKYQKDENRNKYAPINTLNVIRWPNERGIITNKED